jgi:hypothetical protein
MGRVMVESIGSDGFDGCDGLNQIKNKKSLCI